MSHAAPSAATVILDMSPQPAVQPSTATDFPPLPARPTTAEGSAPPDHPTVSSLWTGSPKRNVDHDGFTVGATRRRAPTQVISSTLSSHPLLGMGVAARGRTTPLDSGTFDAQRLDFDSSSGAKFGHAQGNGRSEFDRPPAQVTTSAGHEEMGGQQLGAAGLSMPTRSRSKTLSSSSASAAAAFLRVPRTDGRGDGGSAAATSVAPRRSGEDDGGGAALSDFVFGDPSDEVIDQPRAMLVAAGFDVPSRPSPRRHSTAPRPAGSGASRATHRSGQSTPHARRGRPRDESVGCSVGGQ